MGLIKKAGFSRFISTAINTGKRVAPVLAMGAISAYTIKQIVDKVKNDVRKKRIIEDLSLNDPMLKHVDKDTLMRWYATICYYAPTLANNKLTAAEVLQNFAKFGKIDFNTIKMLIDTEKSISETEKNRGDVVKKFVGGLIPTVK